MNVAIALAIGFNRPAYLEDYRQSADPDGWDYVQLGRNLLLEGHYSRCRRAPYVPDALRTPGYPVVVGLLELAGGARAIYFTHIVLQAGSCWLLFLFVRPFLGGAAAFWASLLFGTDLMLAIHNFEPMSEPLFLLLMLGGAGLVFPVLLAPGECRHGWGRLLLGGFLLGLTILTRPVALYLPAIFAVGCLGIGLGRRRMGRALCTAAVLLVVALAPAGLWAVRNAVMFSLPRLSYVDANNLIYYSGAGAYQLRHGVSVDEARAMISEEFGLIPVVEVQNAYISELAPAQIDAQLRPAVWRVLAKYPGHLLLSSAIGVAKASVSHATAELAEMLNREWVAPGTRNLLVHPVEAGRRLLQNGLPLALAFAWQTVHVVVALGAALLGMVLVLRNRRLRSGGLILLVVLAYFYTTTALFGCEAYWRCRIPVMPFLYVFSGYGIARVLGPGRRGRDATVLGDAGG